MTLPNFVIAGVNKAGTTTLFDAMAQHPDIAASSVKETCFWLPLRYDEPQPGLDDYAEFFADAPESQITMEATPGYFYGGDRLAPAMNESLPDLRVLVVFRDPVDRLVSFFRFQKSMLRLEPDLTIDRYVDECLDLPPDRLVHERDLNPMFGVEGGRYDRYLQPWIDQFGDRLRILDFEDLAADTPGVLRDVGGWLGLDPEPWTDIDSSASNRTVAPKNRTLHRAALTVNRTFERRLRDLPRTKAVVRRFYQSINSGQREPDLTDETRQRLVGLYAPHRDGLASQLDRAGHRVPSWAS